MLTYKASGIFLIILPLQGRHRDRQTAVSLVVWTWHGTFRDCSEQAALGGHQSRSRLHYTMKSILHVNTDTVYCFYSKRYPMKR